MIKIIGDSSLDMSEELKKTVDVDLIPFHLFLDEKEYVDDKNINLPEFFKAMKASAKARSACPSPNDFIEKFKEVGDMFVVTISDKLSGTYNSAILAKKMFEEDYDNNKKIHVFNSKAAACGETLIAIKISELIHNKVSFDEIVENIENFAKNMTTFFISESLDNLIKNGRISKFKGTLASVMNIKPIMGTDDGEIVLVERARGSKKAFKRLVELVLGKGDDFSEKIMTIAHADNIERAEEVKKEFLVKGKFKDVIIVPTAGLSSMYVDHKGIIISY